MATVAATITPVSAWLTYLKERFPLATYLLLTGGIAVSGQLLPDGRIDWQGLAVASVGLLLFFAELRLMDELKDYEKDKIAHPGRPLPRGLLNPKQVDRTIHALSWAMIGYAAFLRVEVNGAASALYAFLVVYLWLMYREFYTGHWLAARPILYAVTHQIIIVPMCMFAVAVSHQGYVLDAQTLAFGLTVLGAFFAYEICRKLKPDAPEVLKTYLQVYGIGGTLALTVCVTLAATYGAGQLGLGSLLWPLQALVVLSLVPLFFKPSLYKAAEGAATLSLLLHLWGVVIQRLSGWPPQ